MTGEMSGMQWCTCNSHISLVLSLVRIPPTCLLPWLSLAENRPGFELGTTEKSGVRVPFVDGVSRIQRGCPR